MIIDSISELSKYLHALSLDLREALILEVKQLNEFSSIGIIRIKDDDLYIEIMEYLLKDEEHPDVVLESHNKYIDIQMTLRGFEGMKVSKKDSLSIQEPYNSNIDKILYHKTNENCFGTFILRPDNFVLFNTDDAHMPQLCLNQEKLLIKKAVVKLNNRLLGE